jgi:hypothetical protein
VSSETELQNFEPKYDSAYSPPPCLAVITTILLLPTTPRVNRTSERTPQKSSFCALTSPSRPRMQRLLSKVAVPPSWQKLN